ncbi:MAG: Gfo/Idh/MocA family protein [Candidatus Nitrosopumilus sp. bin_32a]
MKILILGCGSIGQRHIENLQNISNNHLIEVFDKDQSKLADLKMKNIVIATEESVDSTTYDCVIICTPPITHVGLAIRALKANSNVFIEKPLSNNLEKFDELIQIRNEKDLLVFVGYSFRFNKGLNYIKNLVSTKEFGKILHASAYFGQYLPDWRPNQDFKESYTLKKEMGGGIILDSSHELDYLVWIFGKPESIQANFVLTDILPSNAEAICDVILKFPGNILSTIHMDFVRRKYKRTLEILTENATLEWSLEENIVKIFESKSNSSKIISSNESINDMYVEELNHVIGCIRDHKKSEIISLENGISSMNLSFEILKCNQ